MLKENLEIMLEAADLSFESFVSPTAQKKANEAWADRVKTQEGQLECLEAAENGQEEAVNYLYVRFLPLIRSAFWKYLIGPNRKYLSSKINSGEAEEFGNTAYTMIAGAESPSPYKTFDPSKFSENTDLINQFSYYFYRYLQAASFKIIRAHKSGSISSSNDDEDKEKPVDISYDEYMSNSADAATPDESPRTDLNLIFDDFSEWLGKEKGPEYKGVFDLVRQGYNFIDITEELELDNPQQARNIFNRIKKYFRSQYPELENAG